MKNILVTFSLSIMLISSFATVDLMANSNYRSNKSNDLSNDELLYDLVFDSHGNLISDSVYLWDNETNTRGALISER
ncbi:MAG: hypothetical protein MJZ01_04655 [Bacteroidales bacterium]|nr:hypothetical protein [Bacteroidales bacterium]